MKKERCRLCGGKLDKNGSCTECGYDNSPTLKNRHRSESNFSGGYVVLLAAALVSTFIAIGIVRAALKPRGDFRYSYILGPGIYHIGSDLPAGKYHIQVEKGKEGSMEQYRVEDDYFYGIASAHFLSKHNSERNAYFIEKDCYIVIGPGTELGFYTNDDPAPAEGAVKVENSSEYTLSMFSTAGKDFPAGVYDIIYSPDESRGDITVRFNVPNTFCDEQDEMMSGTVRFDAKNGEQTFKGIPFTNGSMIALNREGAQITIKPSRQTSQWFYDATWGYSQ